MVTIFYYYANYVAEYLQSLWLNHFSYNGGVFLPKLALKRIPMHLHLQKPFASFANIHPSPFYACAKDCETTYVLMEQMQGRSLCAEWENMDDKQRDALIVQLRGHLSELRALPSPYGQRGCSANGGSLRDGRITCTGFVGPFENESGFNEFLITQGERVVFPGSLDMIQSKMQDDHKIYFTHGDLAPRNIMIKDGRIIDWGDTGWYPEHCEMVKAMWCPELGSSWESRVRTSFGEADERVWLLDKEISDHLEGVF